MPYAEAMKKLSGLAHGLVVGIMLMCLSSAIAQTGSHAKPSSKTKSALAVVDKINLSFVASGYGLGPLTFNGVAISSVGSPINSWAWNFGTQPYTGCIGRPAPDPTAITCPLVISHTYLVAGTYTVYLTATDVLNTAQTIAGTITVPFPSQPPDKLTTSLTQYHTTFEVVRIQYTASSSNGALTLIQKSCGAGTAPIADEHLFFAPSNGTTLTINGTSSVTSGWTCEYTSPGTYLPKVTITDSTGAVSSSEAEVLIQ